MVAVHSRDHGGRVKNVRATVKRLSYLTEGRNTEVDVGRVRYFPQPDGALGCAASSCWGLYA